MQLMRELRTERIVSGKSLHVPQFPGAFYQPFDNLQHFTSTLQNFTRQLQCFTGSLTAGK
jgi:phosphoribosylpyrophosphate synthetase